MKLKYSWILALVLTGCQTPQQPTEKEVTELPPTTQQSQVEIAPPAQEKPQEVAVEPVEEVEKAPELTPQQQQDLWKRIGMQLKLPVANDEKVEYYRNWYIKHPSHLRTVSKRAEPYLHLIVEKIEQKNLPMELALLPVVESSYDAFAYSHGSAAGLWQFIPGTGKWYGLEQNYWYDGRRDVSASTDAALKYLGDLNNRFDGNWNHAIAAYNSGGGRVSSAIRKNRRLNKPTDFFSLELPQETSAYVPKLMAIADIVAHQEKYGVEIPAIENKPVLVQVDPKEQLDLGIAAQYADISVKELQSYNPAYNQWATAPDGPHKLLIPIEKKEQFLAKVEKNRGKGVKLIRYKVKAGDSLGLIAQKHKTTIKVIQTANGMSNSNIRAGHYLLIPTSTQSNSAYILSAENRLKQTQSRSRGDYKVSHTVKSGESFWNIAKQHNVSVQSLAKWNGMAPKDTLRVGQKLVVWKKGSPGAVMRTVYYNVRSGDSISSIAHRFKVRSSDVVKWNNLNTSKYLKLGQKLKLYVDVTKVTV
ncbi:MULTISPECIES: LysM peptidoglycan-binding domain-containing protein [Vibrio]|uniref:Membrane-bound lytic murein transglycosylase D n=1 Tax=Vibrio halioticoli NBRC 102217 TaxID=1219072 RepID=V5FC79_9VIBR|nr:MULTISPECIES: LysM peptidoglycan-binding domain-containing protein [Vibrio]MPW35188.1 LysM peptidoglycan-binding domain-containing protein [Vibrio sp. B1Z05]GAD89018.1 membrane-bound lytic murein transglycosylase D [Vibrio halioticoli NBRC 102217]